MPIQSAPSRDAWSARTTDRPSPSPSERVVFRYKQRRAAKKRRLAAMTRKRRIARRFGIAGTWFLGFIAALVVASVDRVLHVRRRAAPETLPLPQVARSCTPTAR